jgi:cation transport ATPase
MNSIRVDGAPRSTAGLTVARRGGILRRMSGHHHHGHDAAGAWRTLAALALACGLLGLGALATELAAGPAWLRAALAAAACVAGAWEAAEEGWHALRWHRRIDVHLLMLLAAAGAWIVGQPLEGVLLLFLFATAGAIEHFAMDRTRGAIDALLDRSPKRARRLGPDGAETEVAVATLAPGDRVVILPG